MPRLDPDGTDTPVFTKAGAMDCFDIADGKADYNSFITAMEQTVREWYSAVVSSADTEKYVSDEDTLSCPFCGARVIKGKFGYFCSAKKDTGCSFSVGKEYCGKTISDAQAIRLIEKGTAKGEKSASADTIKGLLPVLDDCEIALSQLEKTEGNEAAVEGVQLIFNKLMGYLKTKGLERIEAKGEVFDTELHEAVTLFPAPTEDLKGKVIDVAQTGYTFGGKVLRFAKVIVGA